MKEQGRFKLELDMLDEGVVVSTREPFLRWFWKTTARKKYPHLRAAMVALVDGYFKGMEGTKNVRGRKARKREAEKLARRLVA